MILWESVLFWGGKLLLRVNVICHCQHYMDLHNIISLNFNHNFDWLKSGGDSCRFKSNVISNRKLKVLKWNDKELRKQWHIFGLMEVSIPIMENCINNAVFFPFVMWTLPSTSKILLWSRKDKNKENHSSIKCTNLQILMRSTAM